MRAIDRLIDRILDLVRRDLGTYRVRCPVCGDVTGIATPRRAFELMRDHNRATGHQATVGRDYRWII